MSDGRISLDDLADDGLFDMNALTWPGPCRHCGRTSHGFVCCGQLAAERGEVCTWEHGDAAAPKPAPAKGQPGPPKPLRAPRRIDPRRSR